MSEVLVYGSALTTGERNRINTYLAVKYGITTATGTDYVDTTGSVIWNATTNSGYYNNITFIGRDDAEALNHKQSKSQNVNNTSNATNVSLVTIALGSIYANNGTNPNTFASDKSYV